MIYLFYGDGKGKTTASLGQALRSVGDGKRVLMIQFIKGPWKSGEDFVEIQMKGSPSTLRQGSGRARPFSSAFRLMKMGKGFVGILGDKLPRSEHEKAAADALKKAWQEIKSKKWDMVILDEVSVAVELKLIPLKAVVDVVKKVKKMKKEVNLILTGYAPHKPLIQLADLVTEVKMIKHPYYKGVKAKKGLEY